MFFYIILIVDILILPARKRVSIKPHVTCNHALILPNPTLTSPALPLRRQLSVKNAAFTVAVVHWLNLWPMKYHSGMFLAVIFMPVSPSLPYIIMWKVMFPHCWTTGSAGGSTWPQTCGSTSIGKDDIYFMAH